MVSCSSSSRWASASSAPRAERAAWSVKPDEARGQTVDALLRLGHRPLRLAQPAVDGRRARPDRFAAGGCRSMVSPWRTDRESTGGGRRSSSCRWPTPVPAASRPRRRVHVEHCRPDRSPRRDRRHGRGMPGRGWRPRGRRASRRGMIRGSAGCRDRDRWSARRGSAGSAAWPAPSRVGGGDAHHPTASAPARTARWCRTRTVRAAPGPRSRARGAGPATSLRTMAFWSRSDEC